MNHKYIKSGVLLKENDKFLLVQEKAKRAFGLWNIPSGKVENTETFEQAAIREAKEETGYNIVIEKEIANFMTTFPDTKELHIFLGKIINGKLTLPENEIMDAQWFTYKEICLMKDILVGDWVIQAVFSIVK